MIVGIAYHSPLDVISMMPDDIKTTLDPLETKDIFISKNIQKSYLSRLQLVFTSARVLFKENLVILDQGPWGQINSLNSEKIEKILARSSNYERQGRIPAWVRF